MARPRMTIRKWLVVVLLSALYAAFLRWWLDPDRQEIEISHSTVIGLIALLGALPMLVPLIDFLTTLRPPRKPSLRSEGAAPPAPDRTGLL